VQIKNGPLDFQPREPFHPLFGAMPKTPEVLEFQITQEYLGQSTHLVYEAPMFKEILESNINATQKVLDVLENSNNALTGISGVANIGSDINWCGHPFGQANWYAFGRLAWNPRLSANEIAKEWIQQTWSHDKKVIDTIQNIMMSSYENMVKYMTPLGLHHIMGNGHHYGPMPWGNTLNREDWNPVYYHKSDNYGVGFNRSLSGSNAIAQYEPFVQNKWKDSSTCDEKYLLWFHHISWNHKMKNGNQFWDELCYQYNEGVNGVRKMQKQWQTINSNVNLDQHHQVTQLLQVQLNDAIWWRDACLQYFQTFSKLPLPKGYPLPAHDLKYYQSLNFPFAPGNGK
jgi:alpha-glucuronidase